jgi:DNA end-binding protein Ku
VWTGTISFGLIDIPVKLYNAVRKQTVAFNQIDERSMSRIRLKKVSGESGEEVPDEHIVKGYELSKGRYVIVDPNDLEPLIPSATHTIDLEEFVELDEIDPVLFDSPFIVAPGKNPKPYTLLVRAMTSSGKVAIARVVMRNKQYVVALRAAGDTMMMSTMVFADEVVPVSAIEELHDIGDIEVSDREVQMATSLVDSLSGKFDPKKFRDTYREEVLALIERKAAGEEFEVPEAVPERGEVVDLMAALEASVAAAKKARGRHPSGGVVEKPAKKAAPRRRSAATATAADDDVVKPVRARKSA